MPTCSVNAHTHLYSGLASLGMPAPSVAPQNFVQILERVWWRLDRALDERTLKASARYALAEAALAGCTTLLDHHESPNFIDGSLDVLADAAQELGLRVVLTYGATERNGGREEARRGLAECERFIKQNKRTLVRGMVGIHASFTVSDETIREAGALARALGVGVHVHVAEDGADVVDAKRRGFEGPLERLLKLEALPRGSVIAHGVHLSREQVERADAAGLWLVQNPRSNEGNKVGYPRALSASRHVALGTDGWPAKMDDERAALMRLGLTAGDERAVLEARAEAGVGMLSALTASDLSSDSRGAGQPPRDVTVAGKIVVKDGVLQTADFDAVRAHAKEEAQRLWKAMAELPT